MAEGKKELLRQIPRVKLWLVLVLTLAFSAVLLVAAHLTHSLTLRVEAYHALYNVLTLIGCLLTMKLSSGPQSLHNTFGWARLEVLSMLTTLLFFTALCFSVTIESVQTALHVGHQDAMHHPLPVLALGGVGLALNALVFFLIGGYTHHQGCFLEMRDSGSVWVGRQVTQEAVQAGRRTLSSTDFMAGDNRPQRVRQRLKEVVRDVCGLVIMEVCAALVHWDNGGNVALYIDPALAVTSAALLLWLSLPYGKECCHILLQTIPGHIDVENFQRRVMKEFPALVNIHHLHIWTFTPSKVVATAHVVFPSTRVYLSTKIALRDFFLNEGITQVTIQPEYLATHLGGALDPSTCLLRCKQEQCRERECCFSCSPHQLLTSVVPSSSSSSSQGTRRRATPVGEDGGGSSVYDISGADAGLEGGPSCSSGGGGDDGESSGGGECSGGGESSGGGGGGQSSDTKKMQPTSEETTHSTLVVVAAAEDISKTAPPTPSPSSGTTDTTVTPRTQGTTTVTAAATRHSEEGEKGTSEEHAPESQAVYPTYEEEDCTNEPLLCPSRAEDGPLDHNKQDGGQRDTNETTAEEETGETTERTHFLPSYGT